MVSNWGPCNLRYRLLEGYQGSFLFSIFKNLYKMSAWIYFKTVQVSEKVMFLCFRLELCKLNWLRNPEQINCCFNKCFGEGPSEGRQNKF